ncbi:MAG: 5-formyltetrahydrofolate cyclo-ligase [Pseudomonadota bacterium]
MPQQTSKAELRRQALCRRDAVELELRVEASVAIAEIGKANLRVSDGDIVSGFWPIRSEIDPRPLMYALRENGARLCLPVVVDKTTIVFRELLRGAELVETGFGTFGPGADAAVLDPTLMLVPLAAFDSAGHRIGYGAGHYDRAIASLHSKGANPQLVGVAFETQEVDVVPCEGHDVALSAVLTERGLRAMPAENS